jgi:hypothetical protein
MRIHDTISKALDKSSVEDAVRVLWSIRRIVSVSDIPSEERVRQGPVLAHRDVSVNIDRKHENRKMATNLGESEVGGAASVACENQAVDT